MVLGVANGCGRKEEPRVAEPHQMVENDQGHGEDPLKHAGAPAASIASRKSPQRQDTEPENRLSAEAPKKVMSRQTTTRPMSAPERPAPVPDNNEARELVNLIRPEAGRGDAESQYLMGIFYVNGSGVPADRVEALKWLLLASAQDHKEAISARDLVTKLLSAQQRADAEKRAKEFTPAQSPGTAKP